MIIIVINVNIIISTFIITIIINIVRISSNY